jgi:hypothetical protein
MSSRESNILFDDLFTVESVDKDGKKFDRGHFHRCLVRSQVRLNGFQFLV